MNDGWKIGGGRVLEYGARTLVMGILNVTPDSFSDGGQIDTVERARRRAAEMVAEEVDIIDVGGESTRPGAATVDAEEEVRRVVPIVESLARDWPDVPISLDTTKSEVARAGVGAGAAVINDVSGLRFDARIADEAARGKVGLVLMHSRGTPGRMHGLVPLADIRFAVAEDWRRAIREAEGRGVDARSIALDPGVGFGKTYEQNLALVADTEAFVREFPEFPLLVGASRKSFIARALGGGADVPIERRLHGTMATVTAAVLGGASIVRVHDVAAAVETARVADALKGQRVVRKDGG